MEQMVLDTLKEVDAMLEGHFLLSSGKHSNRYFQCAKLLQYPDKAEKVVGIIAEKLKDLDFDMVVGPAMGGVVVAYELARQVKKPGIFAERVDNIMTIRRGFEVKPGTKVIISEDVVTTGKSPLEVAEVLKALGAEVVAITAIVDRRAENVELPYPLISAAKVKVETYESDNCPLCDAGIEYIKPGSRIIK